jgi:IS5 family transposase
VDTTVQTKAIRFPTDARLYHRVRARLVKVARAEGLLIKQSYQHAGMGYRGHDYAGSATIHVDKRQRGRTPKVLWKKMKRRAAVEPSIGHLKNEHRLERNRLKGAAGDAINAILSAAAMNFQKLLRTCERRLVAELRAILDRLQHQSLFTGFLIDLPAS